MTVDIKHKTNMQMLLSQLQNIMEKGPHSHGNKKMSNTEELKKARSVLKKWHTIIEEYKIKTKYMVRQTMTKMGKSHIIKIIMVPAFNTKM